MTWKSQEWKENRDKFLAEHPFCEWHGEPVKATCVHHPQKRGTISDEDYLSMKGCKALCRQCHGAIRRKLKLCPICKEHYYKPRKSKDRCWSCFAKTPFGQAVKTYYDNHPEELKWKNR